ncbi:Phosphoinositide polyphosphatase (Sac family) [Actinomyces slackii]|uniref:Phosphoinositide polyphosphatase (Sac family) n=1 Tax=Actinomyces slackii TaxID=52774 RepID=A0A3S4U0W9_9ACTO|nr:DUF5979 domain-containing protein [Actinomyces slackii]VEG73750.1 Phosphoinositide polyphosphatase (Sac family) [Actinomyces slackii]
MPTSTIVAARRSSRALPAMALAVILATLSIVAGSPLPAQAAPNSQIVVDRLSLEKVDANGISQPGVLNITEIAKLSFTWDASSADLSSGDSFTVGLPSEFNILVTTQTFPVQVEYPQGSGTMVEVGSCTTTSTAFTCTFSSKVDELKAEGFDGFKGSGFILLRAMSGTVTNTSSFNANGTARSVTLPAGSPIGVPGFREVGMTKNATLITATSTSMIWEVSFGSSYISRQLDVDGEPLALDGTTRQTITLTDTLGEGQAFSTDLSRWTFMMRNSAAEPNSRGVTLTNANGRDLTLAYGDFDLGVELNGREATITITGPFAASTNYRVIYPVTFTTEAGTPIPGASYSNTAGVDGTTTSASGVRNYVDAAGVTVEKAPGFGGFEVTKLVAGNAVASLRPGTTFDVTVNYVLPKAASEYPDWSAPGTLGADGVTGSTTFPVTVGKRNPYMGTFPQGTKVTLTEDVASADPAASGYSWGAPAFVVGGSGARTESASFVIADQASTAVSLTNTATIVMQGTFSVSKTVTGVEAGDKDFVFSYTCGSQTGSITAKGDGTAVEVGETFPVGTSCTITEDADAAAIEGYTLTPPQPQTITIDTADQAVAASFTNAYAPVPTPEPSPSPTPSPTPEPTEEPSPTPEPTEEPSPSPSPTEEPSPSPSPTEEPSPSPSPTEEPSPSPSPTEEPSPSPEPTEEPSPSPEPTEEPSPSPEPTEEPSLSPVPTGEPSASVEPTEAPSPSPEPSEPTPTPEATSTSGGAARTPASAVPAGPGAPTASSSPMPGASLARTGAQAAGIGAAALIAALAGALLLARARRSQA